MDSSTAGSASPLRHIAQHVRKLPIVDHSIEWSSLLWGALTHLIRGKTPKRAHLALINLFVLTRGRANDFMSSMLSIAHPPYSFPDTSGVLGEFTTNDFLKIQSQLETLGYVVFERCLPPEFCEGIVRRSLEAECLLAGDEYAAGTEKIYGRYNRNDPRAAWYILAEDDVTDVPEIQELLCDASLLSVAQNYLQAKPIFSGIGLTWSPAVKSIPDSKAAQEFHWDMERIRWLRFFVYLTDVTKDNGPHCFIKGSHRSNAIPDAILKQGYVRQKDETMLDVYGRDAYCEFVGKRGTIIAEDSRGFHKGLAPRSGDRLLLAFELSNSTFGANKRHLIRNVHVPRFREFAKKYPRIYANFDFADGVLK